MEEGKRKKALYKTRTAKKRSKRASQESNQGIWTRALKLNQETGSWALKLILKVVMI